MKSNIERKTEFSQDRAYRYTLWREWTGLFDDSGPRRYVMFVGLNPSTADEMTDDPTIRRCVGFARRWGYNTICMTNLFGWRATDPARMLSEKDPVGPDNDRWLKATADKADMIVAAWGTRGHSFYRDDAVMKILGSGTYCLRLTKNKMPEHPLYVPYSVQPIPFQ